MDRSFYLGLAAAGARLPIGTDLVLHEYADAEAIMRDGRRLGRVMEQAALRWGTPLAIPLMDLRLEKADLLRLLGVDESQVDTFHFEEAPSEATVAKMKAAMEAPFSVRGRAHVESVGYIARQTDLVPVGMVIGPFSLMTKLMSDPITAVAMAGTGLTGADEPHVLMAERCLELAGMAVRRSISAQMAAGARAVLMCEPAANAVYLSPKQIERGSGIFERFVMQPDLRVKAHLDACGVDLIFHDCGELIPMMVEQFATRLDPVILSLGSSRKLWEDAALVPKHIVLYGNLPTRNFYSDEVVPEARVRAMVKELTEKMKQAGHPHILGSECDVLHVPDAAATIRRKVEVMMSC